MSAPFRITLPDGSVREVAPGTTPADIAAAIGPGLAKAAIAARVDGELRDIGRAFEGEPNLASRRCVGPPCSPGFEVGRSQGRKASVT